MKISINLKIRGKEYKPKKKELEIKLTKEII